LIKRSAVQAVDGTLMEKNIGNAIVVIPGMFLRLADAVRLVFTTGKKPSALPRQEVAIVFLHIWIGTETWIVG
jgi:hypothetical protein